jgi:LuxR family maltose regulon positive regulatory protein
VRASGQLSELRGRDLRFSSQETEDFLRHATGISLSEESVQQLQKHIEGWAVGLRFAAALLREGSDSQLIVNQLVTGNDRSLMNYLLEEVVVHLLPRVRQLVLKCSLVQRFTAELCQALLPEESVEECRAILQELAASDMVVAMPGEGNLWYRLPRPVCRFFARPCALRL